MLNQQYVIQLEQSHIYSIDYGADLKHWTLVIVQVTCVTVTTHPTMKTFADCTWLQGYCVLEVLATIGLHLDLIVIT